jgi:hypothetical protein
MRPEPGKFFEADSIVPIGGAKKANQTVCNTDHMNHRIMRVAIRTNCAVSMVTGLW